MTNEQAPAGAIPSLLPLWPEVARVLGMSRQSIYRAAAAGTLPLWPGPGRKRVITAKLAEQIGRPITPADFT